MNKRLLVGLAAAGIIGGGTFGFAATLGVTSDNLGAGGAPVLSCDAAITAGYTAEYNAGIYEVASVDLAGIAALCDGETVQVTLSGVGGTLIAEETETVAQTGGAQAIEFDDGVSAEAVNGIDVVISGVNAP